MFIDSIPLEQPGQQTVFAKLQSLSLIHLLSYVKFVFGNKSIQKRNANQSPSLNDRFYNVYYSINAYTGAPTQTAINQFKIVKILLKEALLSFDSIKREMNAHRKKLTKIGAVYITE